MENSNYMVDPTEAGIILNTPGNPTSEGWKIVTPSGWHFKTKQIADKTQTMGGYWDQEWYCDCTKAKTIIEIYDTNPNLGPAEKTALVDEVMFDTQNIIIRPNEMLIGNWCNDEHGIGFDPRYDTWTTFQEMYDLGKTFIWENGEKKSVTKELYDQIERFCEGNNFEFLTKPLMSDLHYKMYIRGFLRYWQTPGTTGFRANPDHEWYMKIGFRGLVDKMKDTIVRLEKESMECRTDQTPDIRRRIADCRATVRAGEALIRWIKRHADVAKKEAEKATDAKDRERLETIASNCEWISENPPRTFHEAMQMHWSAFMAYYCIEYASHTVTFRPDQVFWKWYEKDVVIDKTLKKHEAADIIASFMMKYHEIGFLVALESLRKLGLGTRDYSVFTIGGQTAEGLDATNDLSMLLLDVIDGYRLHFPDIKVRWHKKFNKNNLRRAVEVMRTGMGSPSIKNDDVAIEGVLRQYGNEISLEEARSWAVVGCNTPGITINSKGPIRRSAEFVNCLKALEFTLFNGKDPDPDWDFAKSIDTGDPCKFKDYEEFYQAWLKQWDWLVTTEIRLRNIVWTELEKTIRRPLLSLLYKRCIDEGRDVQKLDSPHLSFQNIPGWVDSIDCIAGVKSLIFDKKKYSMKQLLEALKADWVGFDEMRQDFKDAPKFGNNEDLVDDIFARATDDVFEIQKHVLDERGQPTYVSAIVVTAMYMLAPHTGAMPNGRKRGESLCDGGINPHADFDKSGAWASMSSAMKIDQSKFKAWIYNQKFDFSSVAGPSGLDKLIDFTMAGMEGGIDQIQCNFMSKDILRDAQQVPEKYPHLSVRISGYSAFFTQLPEYVQDAVIDRVDHEL